MSKFLAILFFCLSFLNLNCAEVVEKCTAYEIGQICLACPNGYCSRTVEDETCYAGYLHLEDLENCIEEAEDEIEAQSCYACPRGLP